MPSLRSTLVLASLALGTTAAVAPVYRRAGGSPGGQVDPSTTPYCSWWHDNDGSMTCSQVADYWAISMADFLRWNPSLTASCGNFKSGWSYCVEASGEPPVVVTTTTMKPTSTLAMTTAPATTTKPGNGIATPAPIQDGMIDNCDAFYFVQTGDNCATVASKNGITLAQFVSWNPATKPDCSGLWANTYACVSIVGHTPSPVTTNPATTTKPSNGITTPTPIQDGMVDNCDAFYFVQTGDNCDTVAGKNGITLAQFVSWNPAVKSDCSGLWANTYACISIIGHNPPPTTTKPPNGVSTPSPIQEGMVTSCKTFYFVNAGENCSTIASKNKITVAQFVSWNPAAKSDCSGLWANTYACIAVL